MKNENLLISISVLVLILLLFNMFSNSSSSSVKEITYSEFTNHVRSGQVLDVKIIGDSRVQGSLSDGKAYGTYVPGDYPGLVELLREHKVELSYAPDPGIPWYLNLFIQWGPFLLILIIWMVMMRRSQGGAMGKLFSLGKIRAQKTNGNRVQVTFKDVAGITEAKEELYEIIEYLRDPARFKKLGGRIPKGVLMSGPPGTGKTLLAKAVAGEANVPFFNISGSDFVEMFVGIGASRVRDLFEEGRKNAPCILFIDEIDAVGRHRGSGMGSGNDEREQTLNQLLVEMDGFDPSLGVIVIASTNRPDVLDHALLRPGRFDRQVIVPLPDIRGRTEILDIYMRKVVSAETIDPSVIAKGTPGFSGADLKNLVNEAALLAARKNQTSIAMVDFEEARDKVLMGPERRSMVISPKERENTAYHEAGHALVAALLDKTDPLHKVTIVPRGRALGVTSFLPENDNHAHDRTQLANTVTVALGGRAAEEIIFNELTTGASNDIQRVTQLLRNMICQWGMSDQLGPMVLDSEQEHPVFGRDAGSGKEYSELTASEIDRELRSMVEYHYQQAKQLLTAHLDALHTLAKELLDLETVTGERVFAILGKPPRVSKVSA